MMKRRTAGLLLTVALGVSSPALAACDREDMKDLEEGVNDAEKGVEDAVKDAEDAIDKADTDGKDD